MLVALYPTKAELKRNIGRRLRYHETSMFGPEFKDNGTFPVVGPSANNRKWYGSVEMKDGFIKTVK